MATTFKTFMDTDVVSSRTLLHESIPLTGTIVSGTYTHGTTTETNIRNYSHGMFQSVYDYPYLSSSANHVFDITFGMSPNSILSSSSPASLDQQKKKINVYNQMAQVLMGYDHTGSVREFDRDGNVAGLEQGLKIREAFFVNFSRLLSKDEIKKGTFSMQVITASMNGGGGGGTGLFTALAKDSVMTITDTNAQNDYRVNSPAGEYGVLYASNANEVVGWGSDVGAGTSTQAVGLVYYQAGIAVLSSSIWAGGTGSSGADSYHGSGDSDNSYGTAGFFQPNDTDRATIERAITGSTIGELANAFRHRFSNVSFNNTTELNSTIYFCRANHNEFNYSSNPTYLSQSKITVKNTSLDNPVSYITTIGMYSADNELLAVAKLSEPIKKDPTSELTFRVRLDY